ncbi:zinc ribbon domain-containing protein [Pseudomonas tructae]|uniref:Zinc ribbon domain-containing protein n=1 Tax=Pseudomonas tructae TaxID=2518644 RepID=A0A411MHV7_9PSED|nr:zinc ribbon domain-containing protein [Pseudomonas tructae]QBF26274.1 zinc ribbon domain-containing protein [Pseudomonas tructae]
MGIPLPLWLILTGVTAYLASTRGRSGPRWFAIGLFLPGIALIALLLMPRLAKTGVDALVHEDLRPCPACAQAINAAASHCKHCAAEVEPIAVRDRSGWVVRFTAQTDEEFEPLAAQMALIDLPTILDEAPHVFAGPFEEKAEAHNVLKYLKSNHSLDGLVTWRTVTR